MTLPLTVLGQLPVNGQPADGEGDRRGPVQPGGQGRPSVQAPVLGAGRNHLWRHQLHRPADQPDCYPSSRFGDSGKGVLLGAYTFGVHAYEFSSLSPMDRIARAVEYGSQIHPQYKAEFDGGIQWPGTVCRGTSGAQVRGPSRCARSTTRTCAIDGRILLAGEHASYIPAWQEGAILSSLDAITRSHAVAGDLKRRLLLTLLDRTYIGTQGDDRRRAALRMADVGRLAQRDCAELGRFVHEPGAIRADRRRGVVSHLVSGLSHAGGRRSRRRGRLPCACQEPEAAHGALSAGRSVPRTERHATVRPVDGCTQRSLPS